MPRADSAGAAGAFFLTRRRGGGIAGYLQACHAPMRRPELLRIALAVGITLAVMGLTVMFFMLVFDQDPVDWFHHLLKGERLKP